MSDRRVTKVQAVKRKLQSTIDILENTDGVHICYADKLECLSNLIYATDGLRHTVSGDEDYEKNSESQITTIWKDLGYSMEENEYGIKMILPPVLHKKLEEKIHKSVQAERVYARHDLFTFLKEEKVRLGITDSFMQDMVLIFTHERTNKGLFDYDNLSTSPYINAISDCFLAADTARNIDFLQRFMQGNEDRTIVHLVRKDRFAKWSQDNYERKE